MDDRLTQALRNAMSLTDLEKEAVRERFPALNKAMQERVLFMLEHEEEIVLANLEA